MGTRRYTSADQATGGDALDGPEARNRRVPVSPGGWGRPLRFERRLVPAVAALWSLALHSIFLFPGWPSFGPAKRVAPKLRARRAAFALMIQGSSDPRAAEEEAKANVPGPAPRPVPPDEAEIERESIAGPRPARIRPPEADLARAEYDRTPLPETWTTERVTVADVARAAPAGSTWTSEGGVRAARVLRGPGVPRYPPVCRREDIEGTGEYLLAIDETGRVTGVKILRSAGHPALDKAARLFLIYRARYEPATLDGVPIPFALRQGVAFELEYR